MVPVDPRTHRGGRASQRRAPLVPPLSHQPGSGSLGAPRHKGSLAGSCRSPIGQRVRVGTRCVPRAVEYLGTRGDLRTWRGPGRGTLDGHIHLPPSSLGAGPGGGVCGLVTKEKASVRSRCRSRIGSGAWRLEGRTPDGWGKVRAMVDPNRCPGQEDLPPGPRMGVGTPGGDDHPVAPRALGYAAPLRCRPLRHLPHAGRSRRGPGRDRPAAGGGPELAIGWTRISAIRPGAHHPRRRSRHLPRRP